MRHRWLYWLGDRVFRVILGGLSLLPYKARGAVLGRFVRLFARLAGRHKIAMDQIGYVYPELDQSERRRIARGTLGTLARTVIDIYSGADLMRMAQNWPPEGQGWDICETARQKGQPIIFVTGHYSSFPAMRAAMNTRGYCIAWFYRPTNNPYMNDHYVQALESVGGPAFPRGPEGMKRLIRSLKQGGQCAVMVDQYFSKGEMLDFLGKPAPTAISFAELALKYGALLVPIYAERQDKTDMFRIHVEPPIPHSDAAQMTQSLNDSLSKRVQARPDQWLWVHRRWKPNRQVKR